jgi:hypothetical protein
MYRVDSAQWYGEKGASRMVRSGQGCAGRGFVVARSVNSVHLVHDYYPFALEDGGRLAPIAA